MSKMLGVVCGLLSFNARDRDFTESFLNPNLGSMAETIQYLSVRTPEQIRQDDERQHLFNLRMACVELARSPHFKVSHARRLQDHFNQLSYQFLYEHREYLSAFYPERLEQFEEGMITFQELLDEVWNTEQN